MWSNPVSLLYSEKRMNKCISFSILFICFVKIYFLFRFKLSNTHICGLCKKKKLHIFLRSLMLLTTTNVWTKMYSHILQAQTDEDKIRTSPLFILTSHVLQSSESKNRQSLGRSSGQFCSSPLEAIVVMRIPVMGSICYQLYLYEKMFLFMIHSIQACFQLAFKCV